MEFLFFSNELHIKFFTHLKDFFLNTFALIVIGAFFYFIEKIKPAVPQSFIKYDFKTELCYPLFNFLISDPLIRYTAVFFTVVVLEPFLPYQIFASEISTLPFYLQVFLAMLITDIAVYIEHRFAHAYLWPFHSLHHMTEEVSWITTFRIHPINHFTIVMFHTIVKFLLGFSGEAILTASFMSVSLAYFQHANINLGFPKPFCYLLVSPRFHRWHHAKCKEAIDKNFCLAFPFLDLIGGTYYCPAELPKEYGVKCKKGEEIPQSFLGQLIYPFRTFAKRIRNLMNPAAAKNTKNQT